MQPQSRMAGKKFRFSLESVLKLRRYETERARQRLGKTARERRNFFPAIDVLQSVSRVMPRVITPEARATAEEARRLMAAYQEAEDLIRVGAYAPGSNAETDRAIALHDPLNAFLRQGVTESPSSDAIDVLRGILGRNEM